jgi:hypothetical protein
MDTKKNEYRHVPSHRCGTSFCTLFGRRSRHPHLQRAKGMLLAHRVRIPIEALLYGLQQMLMLPARDPPLLAGRAALFDSAALTGVGPVAA